MKLKRCQGKCFSVQREHTLSLNYIRQYQVYKSWPYSRYITEDLDPVQFGHLSKFQHGLELMRILRYFPQLGISLGNPEVFAGMLPTLYTIMCIYKFTQILLLTNFFCPVAAV